LVLFGAITLLFIKRCKGEMNKPKLIWRRKYRLYYALTLLEGCRKQVFVTFAIYALTREYHTSLKIIASLMVINGIFSMLGAPIVGKMIDKIGERKILMFCYTCLIFVFIGYATIRNVHILYVLYTLDNILWLSAPCLTTYLKKIADPADLSASLSMGISINHSAAVTVPLIGGFLWNSLGYPITFFGGAVVVFISLLCAARLGIKVVEK
jgi:predicted MFS family arabinose efflux permease